MLGSLAERTAKKLLSKAGPIARGVSLSDQQWVGAKLSPHLVECGWVASSRSKRPVAADGSPLPWYTYPAICFLERSLPNSVTVFEYGCGNSTLWWSERAEHVVACEHDEAWYREMADRVPDSVDLRHIELVYGGNYCKLAASMVSAFDVVVIDGRDRVNCALNVIAALKPGGVIVWDNTEREYYQSGYDFLLNNGFRRIDFVGFGPVNPEPWSTSVFYRDENCLGI